MTQRRALQMHPRLLWDVITKQAGTLQKAVLEGVMNSVDAGATRCDVTIDKGTFSITDDGKGFSNRREIEDFFETFGYPHEEGDARYGRFRMGRGQMFAFGANVWNTNGFRMEVDLKPQEVSASAGLGYDFSELDVPVPGCSIAVSLYRRLLTSEVDEVEREIAKFVAFSPIPVTVNGKVVSKDPAKEKWDVVTDDAYIRYRERGNLSIYNLGVLVHDESSYKYGTGGVVVSRAKLDVNFARNSVMDTCPVWRRTVKRIRADAGTAIEKKSNKITEAQRQSSIEGLLTNRVPLRSVEKLPLFEMVNGNRISLETLGKRLGNPEGRMLGVAPLKDRVASRILESKLALVFSQAMLDIADCETGTELVSKLHKAATRDEGYGARHRFDPKGRKEIDHAEMRRYVPDDMVEVPNAKLRPGEKLALAILQAANDKVQSVFLDVSALKTDTSRNQRWRLGSLQKAGVGGSLLERLSSRIPAGAERRSVRVGESSVSLAWTDGQGAIWFERGMLKHVETPTGMIRLANIMVHEWLHDTPDTDTHVHDVEFYETYHDLTVGTNLVGTCLTNMLECYNRAVKQQDRKPTNALARFTDRADLLAERPPAVEPPRMEAPGDMHDDAYEDEALAAMARP